MVVVTVVTANLYVCFNVAEGDECNYRSSCYFKFLRLTIRFAGMIDVACVVSNFSWVNHRSLVWNVSFNVAENPETFARMIQLCNIRRFHNISSVLHNDATSDYVLRHKHPSLLHSGTDVRFCDIGEEPVILHHNNWRFHGFVDQSIYLPTWTSRRPDISPVGLWMYMAITCRPHDLLFLCCVI